MVPAGKHLEPDNFAGRQVHLRLEVWQELLVIECDSNALLDLDVGNQRPLHALIEPNRARCPSTRRLVERDIGAAQQIGQGNVGPGRGDASIGACLEHLAAHLKRAGDDLQDVGRGAFGLRPVC